MAGASDTNPNSFDSSVLLSGLTNLFRELPRVDLDVLNTVYEQLHRSLDDYYHELKQINDSKEFLTLRSLFQRDWLLRDLRSADFIGTPHGHFDHEETAAGGETSFDIGRPLEPEASRVWFDGIEVPQGQGWSFDTSDPLVTVLRLESPAIPGTVIRIYAADVDAVISDTADGETTVFPFAQEIDTAWVKIYHDNIELTQGIEIRRREILFFGGLTGGTVVRFQTGAQTHNVIAASGQVRVTTPFDITAATIIRLGGINIRDGWVISNTGVTFKTAPRDGVAIRITAPKVVPHDHLSYTEVASAGQDAFAAPNDFGLDAGLSYNVERPVLVFLNGLIVAQAFYSFTATNEITFTAGLSAGDVVVIRYHNEVDNSHAHPVLEQVLTEDLPRRAGVNIGMVDTNRPALVMLNGVVVAEGSGATQYQFRSDSTITFGQKLLAGTRISIVAQKFQWRYRMTEAKGFSRRIKYIDAIQNGIDLPTIVLEPGAGFTIHDDTLYLDQTFKDGWLRDVRVDLEIPYSNFGYLIDFPPRSDQDPQEYVDLLKALWAAVTGGQSERVAENFGRIMLGSPYAEVPGVVHTVGVTSAGHTITIRGDDAVVRQFDLVGMEPAVTQGQRVDRFTALGDALRVVDDVNTSDWYLEYPAFLYAIERYATSFDTAALWDKGLRSTYRVTATDPYNASEHAIDVPVAALDFRLIEDLNNGQHARVSLLYAADRFDTVISRVESLPDRHRIFLDQAFTFVPAPDPAEIPAVELGFKRQRRHDVDFVLDDYIKEHLDPVAQQIYSLFRHNLFVVEITQGVVIDQSRLELVFLLLDRIKAAETNYIVVGSMPDLVDDLPADIGESDPTTGSEFAQVPAYFGPKIGAYGINYFGP